MAAYGIDLVDEHDAGRVALRLLEQVTHTGCAHAHEHLHELRAADVEEWNARLAGHGLGEQRLAGPRRADQEDTLGDAGAQGSKLLRVLKELYHLSQFFLRLFHPSHVQERHAGTVAAEHAGFALAEAHRLVITALRLAQEEEQDGDDEDYRQERKQYAGESAPEAGLRKLHRRKVRRRYTGVL